MPTGPKSHDIPRAQRRLAFSSLAAGMGAFLIGVAAHAGPCIEGDSFSFNKTVHFAGTGAIAFGVAQATGSPEKGFLAGMAAGLAREVYKEKNGMRCEYYSLAYDLAGSAAGAYYGSRFTIAPRRGGGFDLAWNASF
jgi:hypothetical protein